MTHRERFVRTLTGRAVDRVPFIKLFGWSGTLDAAWNVANPGGPTLAGILKFYQAPDRGWSRTPVNVWLGRMGEPVVVEDRGEYAVKRDTIGSVALVRKGGKDFRWTHLDWPVKSRKDWERIRSVHFQADDPERFPPDWAEQIARYRVRDYPLALPHSGVYGCVRSLLGDENLSYALHDDPVLVHEIMDFCTDMAISVWERMVKDVSFDLIECPEDMCFRGGCFLSPGTFREFLKPNYRKISEFARRHGIEIILIDSDGFIEELTGLTLESGVTALFPYEVQAGNDPRRVRTNYPLAGILGGLDKNVMTRDRTAVDREMEKARDYIRELGRYIPGPDHGVLSDANLETFLYFWKRLREVVMTTAPGAGAGSVGN